MAVEKNVSRLCFVLQSLASAPSSLGNIQFGLQSTPMLQLANISFFRINTFQDNGI